MGPACARCTGPPSPSPRPRRFTPCSCCRSCRGGRSAEFSDPRLAIFPSPIREDFPMKNRLWIPAFLLLAAATVPATAGDSDDDGIPNKYDLCKKEPEDIDNF